VRDNEWSYQDIHPNAGVIIVTPCLVDKAMGLVKILVPEWFSIDVVVTE